jgi:uncharacterized membrane protein
MKCVFDNEKRKVWFAAAMLRSTFRHVLWGSRAFKYCCGLFGVILAYAGSTQVGSTHQEGCERNYRGSVRGSRRFSEGLGQSRVGAAPGCGRLGSHATYLLCRQA